MYVEAGDIGMGSGQETWTWLLCRKYLHQHCELECWYIDRQQVVDLMSWGGDDQENGHRSNASHIREWLYS